MLTSCSYLEYTAILPARTFLARFISLLLAAHPDLLVVRFAFPPVNSALSKISSSASVEPDEMIVTKLASINFLQLTLKTCQTGAGEGIEKIKGTDGTYKDSKGKGKMAWTTMLAKYEKDVAWLRRPEAKDVRTSPRPGCTDGFSRRKSSARSTSGSNPRARPAT